LTRPRDPLLNYSSTEFSIDDTALGARNSVNQNRVPDIFPPRKPAKPCILKDP
jgi:hypothetical protein